MPTKTIGGLTERAAQLLDQLKKRGSILGPFNYEDTTAIQELMNAGYCEKRVAFVAAGPR